MTETYCYPPDFKVLRNRFNIHDEHELDLIEREFVTQRMRETIPAGQFDLAHLRTIHRHLFQDVYEWAGEVRTVEISKGSSQFQPRRLIATGMENVHQRLVRQDFLQGLDTAAFAREAGHIIGDVNHAHPFREGNGRTQLLYLKQLAEQAGHAIDLRCIDRDRWMAASRESHLGSYGPLEQCIVAAIGRTATGSR